MSLYLDGVPDLRALSGARELEDMPWHFTVVNADSRINSATIRGWIWKNLEGRFCLKAGNHFNKWRAVVGFEDPMEASAYLLSQPLLTTDYFLDA